MQILTHALAGWVGGNLFTTTPKERLACIAISLLPDIDGLGLLFGVEHYLRWHHVLAHNLLIAVLASSALCVLGHSHLRVGILYLALFHLHIVMDLLGSGHGWGVSYLWPFSAVSFTSSGSWDFRAWQNYIVLVVLMIGTVWIAHARKRTPLESIAPRLDSLIVDRLNRG